LNWADPTNLANGDSLLSSDFHIFIERDGVLVDSVAGGSKSFLDSGLNDGQEYTYSIYTKVDSTGFKSETVSATWTSGGSPLPTAPTQVNVSSQGSDMVISWVNPSVNIDGTPMDDLAGINLYQDGLLHSSFTRSSSDSGQADSEVVTPLASQALTWYLTSFDNENPFHESATTDTLVTPVNGPVLEAFLFIEDLDPLFWRNENADVNDRSVSPPSSPYSLNFNGKPSGGDVVELNPLDLSGYGGSGVVFSYFYQPEGSGNAPEAGDSLRVYFRNDAGAWVLVRGYDGMGYQPFVQEVIDIESAPGGNYIHSQFQVRLRNIGSKSSTTPNDDWFVDNIYLGLPSSGIVMSSDSLMFDTTAVGQTSVDSIEVYNVGVSPLVVTEVLGVGGVFGVDIGTFTVDVGSSRKVAVSFTPPSAGNYAGQLEFVSNDPVHDTLRVYVWGYGELVTGISEVLGVPKTFAVSPNYPNPFNPTTSIKYQLPQSSDVRLVIYNVLGQRVRTLLNNQIEAGYHEVVWDGLNDYGNQLGSGIYIYRFEAGDYSRVQKMIMMK
jgi:hypothetical protein